MAITFNPQINYNKRTSANQSFGDAPLAQNAVAETSAPSAQPIQAPKTTAKGIIAKIAYSWVNLVEGTKGIVSGLLAGLLAGTAVAGISTVSSGIKNFKAAPTVSNFLKMFSPKASLGKTGKVLSYVAAGAVFVGHMIAAKLKANKRTSNVDHMLYEGHRN